MIRSMVCPALPVCRDAKYQVPGLRRGYCGGNRFQVAHLSNENHIRVLAQYVAQRLRKGMGICAYLPLINPHTCGDDGRIQWGLPS